MVAKEIDSDGDTLDKPTFQRQQKGFKSVKVEEQKKAPVEVKKLTEQE